MTSELKVVAKFNDWIKCLYQTHKIPVPEYVTELVRAQIDKRYGSTNNSDMNTIKIGRLLREMNFEDYYGKEAEILQALDTKAIPDISHKCKERMKQLLIEMQPAYLKHSKNSHITFSYVMYKICQQFEQNALLPFIKLNVSHEKLYKYDRVWHLICDEMKWYFIKSDPTICSLSPQPSPLLMGLGMNVNIQMDRDLETWSAAEILKLQKGIEKQLSLEQLAVGHNRSLKNIESKVKSLVIEYHESKEHNIESIKTLTGLAEEIIVDTISRYETRKSRNPIIEKSKNPKEPSTQKSTSDMKELLEVLKDIQTMMRYLVNKHG